MGECEQEVRRHADPELLSLLRLHRLCMEGAPQDKGAEAIHTGRFKHKSSPEGRQLKSKQQENLALLATTNTDVYELLPLQCGLFHEMLLSISMSSTGTQF